MQISNGIYSDTITLNSYDVDSFNTTHTSYYFRTMQEVAGAHAYQRNVAIAHLRQDNKTWVVTRTKMTIPQYIRWPNTFRIETWPQQPWKLYFPRVCRAWNAKDELLFESLTHWVVMDTTTQRPLKPQAIVDSFDPIVAKDLVDPNLGKRVSFDEGECADLLVYEPTILYTDNDINMHVNNVVFLQWMLDSLPFAFRDSHVVGEVDISYLAQTFREDHIRVRTGISEPDLLESDAPTLSHEVLRVLPTGETQAVCVATTTWRRRDQRNSSLG
jgi:acyl-ACP thioesterase